MADSEAETDAILKRAWDVVVRRNPMLMATMRPDYDFKQLKDMIRDCFEKGLSVDKTFEHTVAELLETARFYTQPSPEGDLGGFGRGDRVEVIGRLAEVSICMQGPTLEVRVISEAE